MFQAFFHKNYTVKNVLHIKKNIFLDLSSGEILFQKLWNESHKSAYFTSMYFWNKSCAMKLWEALLFYCLLYYNILISFYNFHSPEYLTQSVNYIKNPAQLWLAMKLVKYFFYTYRYCYNVQETLLYFPLLKNYLRRHPKG